MSDLNKRGIVLGKYLKLLPLMKIFPHLKMRDIINLDTKYPESSVNELIDIVKATRN